jgi:hyperosmotically inducible protein
MKMSTYKGVALWLIIVGFSPLLACQTPAGRSTGEVIDDSTITTKVKAKLFVDDQLSGFAISVKTFEGEVTLTGAVKSAEQKEQATDIAQSVSGVRSVNNLLKIKP